MNVHPMLVHFPIALLTIYALLELARFPKLQNHPSTFTLKAFLIIVGVMTLIATYQSGEIIEDAFAIGDMALLVERHATFAVSAYVIFAILGIGYLLQSLWRLAPQKPVWKTTAGASALRLSQTILSPSIAPCLAFLGLIAITITGALGGAIVHGPEIDPAVAFIYHLFVR